jgi:hypothetical protein
MAWHEWHLDGAHGDLGELMGHMTPDKPKTNPIPQARAQCAYCGRYGDLGQCEGCGAPTEPGYRIEVTTFGDIKPRYIWVKG